MKATFALLANTEVHNWMRKLAWGFHQKYRTGTIDCRLPPLNHAKIGEFRVE
jgi:hypothetical protein